MYVHLLIDSSDFLAAVFFIYGIKRMSSPLTARSGIIIAGIGMVVAVLASFLYVFSVRDAARAHVMVNVTMALVALAIGLGWAWWRGRTVAITAMPQMVALFNGMGGGAAAAIAAVELSGGHGQGPTVSTITALGALIGSISLSGSIIAWAKLDGRINKPFRFKGQQVFNCVLFLLTVIFGAMIAFTPHHGDHGMWIGGFFTFALLFGVLMTTPIGGADMPVVISLYDAFTGLAVGLEGFVLQNPALITPAWSSAPPVPCSRSSWRKR